MKSTQPEVIKILFPINECILNFTFLFSQVCVKMKNLENGTEFIWPKEKFLNRLYLMKEMYNNYEEEEDDWDLPEVRLIVLLCIMHSRYLLHLFVSGARSVLGGHEPDRAHRHGAGVPAAVGLHGRDEGAARDRGPQRKQDRSHERESTITFTAVC